ncbi:MAG: FAD-binding protein, partial [Rhodospirillales bacterium]|nr:FAD-binding protein [Rhodospirillales bacterium]
MTTRDTQVLVVGAGNAALSAALAAAEQGARVLVLERAPFDERGGNSRFTAGAIRFAHNGLQDLLTLMPDLSDEEKSNTDFGTYTRDDYFDDMGRVTRFRADPDLVETLIDNSLDTLQWMKRKGVRFQPSYGRQAFKVDGRFRFWGGLCLETWGGGPGLVDMLSAAAEKADVEILYDT